jgi:hypothetical protein
LPFGRNRAFLKIHDGSQGEPMNVALAALGCILMALGLVMAADRAGYVYFVVGPRFVLAAAGAVAMLAFWIRRAAR